MTSRRIQIPDAMRAHPWPETHGCPPRKGRRCAMWSMARTLALAKDRGRVAQSGAPTAPFTLIRKQVKNGTDHGKVSCRLARPLPRSRRSLPEVLSGAIKADCRAVPHLGRFGFGAGPDAGAGPKKQAKSRASGVSEDAACGNLDHSRNLHAVFIVQRPHIRGERHHLTIVADHPSDRNATDGARRFK